MSIPVKLLFNHIILNLKRFCNYVYESLLCKDNVDAILITLKENFGINNRRVFDEMGIIRDTMQNHLLQIASYLLMPKPKNFTSQGLRNAKVEALKQLYVADKSCITVGQYESYLREEVVRKSNFISKIGRLEYQ